LNNTILSKICLITEEKLKKILKQVSQFFKTVKIAVTKINVIKSVILYEFLNAIFQNTDEKISVKIKINFIPGFIIKPG